MLRWRIRRSWKASTRKGPSRSPPAPPNSKKYLRRTSSAGVKWCAPRAPGWTEAAGAAARGVADRANGRGRALGSQFEALISAPFVGFAQPFGATLQATEVVFA